MSCPKTTCCPSSPELAPSAHGAACLSTSFSTTAERLGAQLCRDALWAGGRCNWLGSSMEPVGGDWQPVTRSYGGDLYAGTSGVALFLAHLWARSGERLFAKTAAGAAAQAISRRGETPPASRLGFWSGWTGLAYALVEVGTTLERPELVEAGRGLAAELCAELLGDEMLEDDGLDVIAGSAGAVPGLLWLHRRLGDGRLLELALRCGEHLLARATKREVGWSWPTLEQSGGGRSGDLTGFAHGAAGIATALLELFAVTGEERFLSAAEEGFRYEQQLYEPAVGNWPDLRLWPGDDTLRSAAPSYGLSWCAGAPGIGLSRLRALELGCGGSEELRRAEARAAIATTRAALEPSRWQPEGSFCLCHGRAGNAEVLLYGAEVLGHSELRAAAEKVGLEGIARYESEGAPWPCGVKGGGETPGWMLGLAGIGAFYLRLADPAGTPSPLILRPEHESPHPMTRSTP